VHPHRSGREGERGHDKDKPGQCVSHITPYLLAIDTLDSKAYDQVSLGLLHHETARQLNWSQFERNSAFSTTVANFLRTRAGQRQLCYRCGHALQIVVAQSFDTSIHRRGSPQSLANIKS